MTADDKPGATYVPTNGYKVEDYADREEGLRFARAYFDWYAAFGVHIDPAYFTDERLAELGREPV
jgi:hypothetical protein